MEAASTNTEHEPAITVRINPANRTVDTRTPEYQQAWTKKFDEVRDEIEAELRQRVEAGELVVDTSAEDHMAQTTDEALHYMAHTQAEQVMQQWALLCAIGLQGIDEGYDHGRVIRYIDDPDVEPFTHELVEDDETLPTEPTADDAINAYRQFLTAGNFSSESGALPNEDRGKAMHRFNRLMDLLTPGQRQTVWDEVSKLAKAE